VILLASYIFAPESTTLPNLEKNDLKNRGLRFNSKN